MRRAAFLIRKGFRNPFLKICALVFGLVVLSAGTVVAQVGVTLPDTTGVAKETGTIPVQVDDLSGKGVLSFEFSISYNADTLSIVGVETAETIASDFNVVSNTQNSGTVTVSGGGTRELSGSGTLVNLQVRYKGAGTSPLEWTNFRFNEGSPTADISGGTVTVEEPPPGDITVSLPEVTGNAGSSAKIPVTVSDTDGPNGEGILSFDFAFSYDDSVVEVDTVTAVGTLTQDWTIEANVGTPGKVSVSAGNEEPLSGDGEILIEVDLSFVAEGNSSLEWRQFQFNEGDPTAELSSGEVTVTTGAPTGLDAEAEEGEIKLTWNGISSDDLIGYNVYRSPSSFDDLSGATKLNNSPVSSPRYTDSEVETGTEYFYRVTAVDSEEGETEPSSEESLVALPSGWEVTSSEAYENLFGYDYKIKRYADKEGSEYVLVFRDGKFVRSPDESSSVIAWDRATENGFISRANQDRIEKWKDREESLRSIQRAAAGRVSKYWEEATDASPARDVGFWGTVSASVAAGAGVGATLGGLPGAVVLGGASALITTSYEWAADEASKRAALVAGDNYFDDEYATYLATSDWLRSKGWDLETLTREQMEENRDIRNDIDKLATALENIADNTTTLVNRTLALSDGPLTLGKELLSEYAKTMASKATNSFLDVEAKQKGELYKYWAEVSQSRHLNASVRLSRYLAAQLRRVDEIQDLSDRPVLDEVLHDVVYARQLYRQLEFSRYWSLALRAHQLSEVEGDHSGLRYEKTIQKEVDLATERFNTLYQKYQSGLKIKIDNLVKENESSKKRLQNTREALGLGANLPVAYDRVESEVYPAPIGFEIEGAFAIENESSESVENVSLEVLNPDGLELDLQTQEVDLNSGESNSFSYEIYVEEENAKSVHRPLLKLTCDGCGPDRVFSADLPTSTPFGVVRMSSQKDVYHPESKKKVYLNFNSAINTTVDSKVSLHVYDKKIKENSISDASLEKSESTVKTISTSSSKEYPVGPYWVQTETTRGDVTVKNRVGRLFWVTPSKVEGNPEEFDFSSPQIVASQGDKDIGGRLQRALELSEDALTPVENRAAESLLEDVSGDVVLLGGGQANPLVDRLVNEGRLSSDRWNSPGEAVAKVVDDAFPEDGVDQAFVVAGYYSEDTFAAGLRTLDYIDETVSSTVSEGETANLDPVDAEISFDELDGETEVEVTQRTGVTEEEVGLGQEASLRPKSNALSVGDPPVEGLAISELWTIELDRTPETLKADACFRVGDQLTPNVEPSELVVLRRPDEGSEWEITSSEYRPGGFGEQICAVGLDSFSDFVIAQSTLPEPPTGLSATASGEKIRLNWSGNTEADVAGYHLYRSAGGELDTSRAPLNEDLISENTFADTTADVGEAYRYGVTAVDTAGNESALLAEASAFLPPEDVEVSIARSFGNASGSQDYRLVALPGRADTSLTRVLDGEAGAQWQAYLDDGSQEDFLVKYDGSGDFRFESGNGFWITATDGLTFEASVPAVELKGDSAATIGLQAGWNVISNPLGKDVAWSEVQAATGTDLQPLWAFGGSFDTTDTFTSAAEGRAYYLFNETGGPDSLIVPYPGASEAKRSRPKQIASGQAAPDEATEASASTFVLAASVGDGPVSKVSVGLAGSEGGEKTVIAPPGRFEPVSLRIQSPEAESPRTEGLMAATRASAEGDKGYTFQVRLTSRTGWPVELSFEELQKAGIQGARLLRPKTGETYNLREEPTVTIGPEDGLAEDESVSLKLAVGTESYVESEAESVLPDEVRLTSYPNPIRRQGTLEYALPEASEVTLKVYDVLGREVATIERGLKQAGRHQVTFEADRLSSGAYFGRLKAGGQTQTQKITVIR